MKTFAILVFIAFAWFKAPSQALIQETINSVGLVSYTDKSNIMHFGTGTLISKPVHGKGTYIFLVTNLHVLPKKYQNDSVHFRIRNKNEPAAYFDLAIQIYDNTGSFSKRVKLDPDGNDLAVINISDAFNRNKDLEYLIREMFSISFLIQRDSMRLNHIEIGNEILFAGYPNILYNNKNLSPILRSGIIASSPSEDYYFSEIYRREFYIKSNEWLPEKFAGFLIDANVFNGSSGSLVFTKPTYIKPGKDQKFQIFIDGDLKVLGVLTTSYFDINSRMNDRLQLGGVIASDQILKTINLFVSAEK